MGEQSNGVPRLDLIELERNLLSSSTKRRIATLGNLQRALDDDGKTFGRAHKHYRV